MEAHCATLGPRFRFFHFDDVQGFKAGALNLALELTDPEAKFVAVIDSDYQRRADLAARDLALFRRARASRWCRARRTTATPMTSSFKAMAYEEYRGFFQIGMVERNEHNAIIQHGTMTHRAQGCAGGGGRLEQWCITEDTELGFGCSKRVMSAAYIPQSMGKGLIPDTLKAFMTPALPLGLWRHADLEAPCGRDFPGPSATLTGRSATSSCRGWLPWISDGLGMVVTLIGAGLDVPDVGGAAVTSMCRMPALSAAAMALFVGQDASRRCCSIRQKVGSGVKGALMASVAGLSLTHTVGKAMWAGLFTRGRPFLRTPKCADAALLSQALRGVWQETTLLVFLPARHALRWLFDRTASTIPRRCSGS